VCVLSDVLSAALDAGVAIAAILIFFCLQYVSPPLPLVPLMQAADNQPINPCTGIPATRSAQT
jgi:hypothetical protein